MTSLNKNIFANYLGRAWPVLLSVLLVPVYIRFLGVEAYGLVGFFITLSAVMGVFDLGIGATMNRELAIRSANPDHHSSQRDLVRTFEIIYWVIAIVVGILVVLCASSITNSWVQAEDLDNETIVTAVQLMGLAITFRFPMSLYQGGLMGLQKQVLVNKILIIYGTVRHFGAVAVLLIISKTLYVFFAWQVFMSVLASFTFLFALWSKLPECNTKARFRVGILSETWRYAAAVSLNAMIGIFLTQLDKFMLSTLLSLKMFAYYTIAATVASAIWMIIIPFNTAVFPKIVELREKMSQDKLISFFHSTSQVLSILLLPIGFLLIFFSKEILFLWLGDDIIAENAYLILSFLVFGTLLNGLVSMPITTANAYGWPMLTTYTNLAQAIVFIPLIIFLVNKFNGLGASIGWVIINSTYILITVPIFFKKYFKNQKKSWYLYDIIFPFIVSFFICLISKLTAPEFNSILAIIFWLIMTATIAIIFTAISMSTTRNYLITKFLNFGNS